MAECQGREGEVWSERVHDGNSVISLLREHLRGREMGYNDAGCEGVQGNGWRKSSHEGLRKA